MAGVWGHHGVGTPPALVDIVPVFQSGYSNLPSHQQWTSIPRRYSKEAHYSSSHRTFTQAGTHGALRVLPTELMARESLGRSGQGCRMCRARGSPGQARPAQRVQTFYYLKLGNLPIEGLKKLLFQGMDARIGAVLLYLGGGIPLVSQLRQQDSRGAEPTESCKNPSLRC